MIWVFERWRFSGVTLDKFGFSQLGYLFGVQVKYMGDL